MKPLALALLLLAAAARAQDADEALRQALQQTQVPAVCPAGTVAIEKFCIDKYEAPNQPGVKPFTFVTASEAERWCRDNGKRLCKKAEWERACRGPKNWKFPYGTRYKAGVCNDAKTWRAPDWGKLGLYPKNAARAEAARLDQSDESGKARLTVVNPDGKTVGCESAEGVFDLVGNVTEFVATAGGSYDRKGCFWAKCQYSNEPDCGYDNGAHPGDFRSYEAGFRCCADSNR